METSVTHRLVGLEPDNLLAFLALLGLLRCLEEAQPDWCPRVAWSVAEPPVRPVLQLRQSVSQEAILQATAKGIGTLASHHAFAGHENLKLTPSQARQQLQQAVAQGGYPAELWSALTSDAVVREDKGDTEPTPLCLMFGQGHQHFLKNLAAVPLRPAPPARGKGRNKQEVTEEDCLREAFFAPWSRPDQTPAFRWDPQEASRYAFRATDPSKDKTGTQHGANRVAAIGFSVLSVAPQASAGVPRLSVCGGCRDSGFRFTWPIWREPMTLAAIGALMATLDRNAAKGPLTQLRNLGVVELRRAKRISVGKFMSFEAARAEMLPDA